MDGGEPQVVDKDGERGRNRTYNLLIKSQLLCQLSYAPTLGIVLEGQFKIIAFTRVVAVGIGALATLKFRVAPGGARLFPPVEISVGARGY